MLNITEGEILLVNKPYRWTSFDVIGSLRGLMKHLLGGKKIKVGHAGTLDPLATGLLIVCTGKATKRFEEFKDFDKEYTGTFVLGATICSILEFTNIQINIVKSMTKRNIPYIHTLHLALTPRSREEP